MTPREVNALFTEAGRIDPRMRRNNPEERADMATSWARLLADVAPSDAVWALDQHYRQSTAAIMPADIIALVADMPDPEPVGLEDGRGWLERRGIDADEFDRRIAAGERPTRALRELSAGAES